MSHILTECDAPGRCVLWELAEGTLAKKGVHIPCLSYGMVLGIPSLELSRDDGGISHSRTRLARIVLSETAHMVWKMRCERVIGWDGEQERTHPEALIRNKWYAAINERLRLDIERTKKRWKKRRIPPTTVLETWRGTLHDEKSLPEDWTGTSGVLVGKLHPG
ncbi:hypothetical protein C2E23DRAFT_735008 [Lenzites betulinus]|nr:hypothetical protein C2E23DRAFT_735008 [Lenzites betulinus]